MTGPTARPPGRGQGKGAHREEGTLPGSALEPRGPGRARHLYLSAPGRVQSLLKEVEILATRGWEMAPRLESIHLGSTGEWTMEPRALGDLLEGLPGRVAPGGEVALEVEGRSVTEDRLNGWLKAGVTRINLTWPLPDPFRPIATLLHGGALDQWGVDVEFGGDPHELRERERLLRSLSGEQAPSQISLMEAPSGGSDDQMADAYLALASSLLSLGYQPWEMTSFSRPGREPIHFRAVWEGQDVLGLGPGAHSFLGGVRRWNLTDPEAYFSRIQSEQDPVAGMERPDPGQRRLEEVWSRLRLATGIPLAPMPAQASRLRDEWVQQGWAQPDQNHLRLTLSGWLILDSLAIRLAEVLAGWPER